MEQYKTYNSIYIANYFIGRGISKNRPVSPLKLQMLLFYAYGWYVVYTEKEGALFDEQVEAWNNGPFIPSVYNILKPYKNNPVTELINIGNGGFRLNPNDENDAEVLDFLDMIWDLYGHYSDIELANSSHNEGGPWFKTVSAHSFADGRYNISVENFYEYFSKFIKKTESSKDPVTA